eukprot:6485541-Amphidinium_carterae.2
MVQRDRFACFMLLRQNQSETKLEQGGHVFVDADAMKDVSKLRLINEQERVRKNLTKPKYDVKDFYKKEGMWQMIATSHMFEMVTLVVTALAQPAALVSYLATCYCCNGHGIPVSHTDIHRNQNSIADLSLLPQVITLNAIWIAVDTDLNDAPILLEAAWPFQACQIGQS